MLGNEPIRDRERLEHIKEAIERIQANAPKDIPLTDEEIQEEINAVRYGKE